jgi:hypothetical protein
MTQPVWSGRCDPQAPLLVIGAGRSGSSLLARIFGAHPAMCFHDENDFLTPQLWQLLWQNRRPRVVRGMGTSQTAITEMEAALIQRLASLLPQLLVSILGIDPTRTHWGFKEVWNGSATHRYSWDIYDLLFPRATWVHLVRHPFEFAASCAAWNNDAFTDSYLEARLSDWTAMVEYSRLRATQERFFEVRHEDIVASTRHTLEPVFESLGLDWSEACARAVKRRVMVSERQREKEQTLLRGFRRSKALAKTAASLGYVL